ncbi:MAG: hypothetical protein A3K18_08120 [Lentisphaerae bacterium RIFOXYA12_64_32]|nr:MAG: hypothetical protein A3K18_08120 [Lentisphaerae bacterium RIFOXYA12_64_32]
MKLRPDLIDANSPKGLEVVQLTDEALPSSHVYMEAQIFTPDSKRFILHRSAHAHGSDKNDAEHRYLLCDTENGCRLTPITTERGATAPSVSPDGKYLYYFVNETEVGGGRLTLKRVNLDGTGRTTVMCVDAPLPGTAYRPSDIYPLSTISSDGQRLALSCFLGDGNTDEAPWGLMVFDIRKATVRLILSGTSWCNIHPQYCRATDPASSHAILVQDNHDCRYDRQGKVTTLVGGLGADIHLIQDDGSDFRTLPWGRDGNEFCQGHQCWRGCSTWAITSTGTRVPSEQQLIEGQAIPDTGHQGLKTPGAQRNHLSRSFTTPNFYHFQTDAAGTCLVTDAGPHDTGGRLFFFTLGAPGKDAFTSCTYLLNPHNSWKKGVHIHPFLSPDGKTAFFNSDESGVLQAYMVRGW